MSEPASYVEYKKGACAHCAAGRDATFDGKHGWTDYDPGADVDSWRTAPCAAKPLNEWAEDLARIVNEVDEVLVVNWVGPRVDGDYRKALHDLIQQNILEHDDPRVSEVAAKRQEELGELKADLATAQRNAQVWEQNYNKCHASLCAVNDRENEAVIKLTAAREQVRHLHMLTHTPIGTRWRETALARLKIIDRILQSEDKTSRTRVFCTRCLALGLDKVKGEPDGNAQSS